MFDAPADAAVADMNAATPQSVIYHIHHGSRSTSAHLPVLRPCDKACVLKHFISDCHPTGPGQEHWCQQLFGKEATGHCSVCQYSPCCLSGTQLASKLSLTTRLL